MKCKWKSATPEQRILALMEVSGMSEARLAKLTGLSQSTVHRIVAGEKRSHLTVARLELIAPILGVTPIQLLSPEVPTTVFSSDN